MNKRIQQLATEAELELTIETKKFAELIVRECEKSIKSVPTHFEAQDKIIVECLKAISEHFFGVEQ